MRSNKVETEPVKKLSANYYNYTLRFTISFEILLISLILVGI